RDVQPAPGGRLGVPGRLQQSVHMGLLDQRVRVAEDAGQQAYHRLQHHQDGHLAAEQHVVPERDLGHRHAGRGLVEHALVDPLVPPAGEDQVRLGRELGRPRLGEGRTGRRGDDQVSGPDRVQGEAPRFGAHHHAGTATVRGVVDHPVHVGRPPPQVVDVHVKQSGRARPADQGQVERREVLRKDRDNVDLHRSNSPSGGASTTRPPATSTSGTIALTNGTRAVRPSGRRSTSRSDAGAWSTRTTSPSASPAVSTAARPTSWWSWNSSGSAGGVNDVLSTHSSTPRSSSARSRSYTPSNTTMSRPWCGRTDSTVSAGPRSVTSTDPGANRCSGSSVRTWTTTSPRMPCGRMTCPTTSSISSCRRCRRGRRARRWT